VGRHSIHIQIFPCARHPRKDVPSSARTRLRVFS
jgi:hypothetical protein